MNIYKLHAALIATFAVVGCGQRGAEIVMPTKEQLSDAQQKQGKRSALLEMIATGATAFAVDLSCAPGAPEDLIAKPTAERIKALGCKEGSSDKWLQYLPPSVGNEVNGFKFVRRWDGLAVIEWQADQGQKSQCTFLDAEHSKCEIEWPQLPQAK